jgi:acylphosphatase
MRPPTAEVVARGFRVVGRVQGVGFRWWTRAQARALGVAGSVRNLPDGSVEVRAQGSADALDRLRQLLHRGPPAARVERVEEFPIPVEPGRTDFVIAG